VPTPAPSDDVVAAIDCGTNSTRLLVMDRRGRVLAREMRITRLGQGVDETKELRDDAIRRTLDVLAAYRDEMDRLAVGRGRQVATSAVRDAANGSDFLRAATGVTGLATELLEGTEEGRLSFEGATAQLPPVSGADVVIDIGGGSTELVVGSGDGGPGRERPPDVISLDLGCVRISERYFSHDPPTSGELDSARRGIDAELARAVEAIPLLGRLPGGSRCIGLAGTVSTVVTLELGLVEYDRDKVHLFRLRADVVDRWRRVLASETSAERLHHPGMAEGREDVLLGGVLVLAECLARLGLDECLVSEADILDGLVASQLSSIHP
jgi:exopolyphosphatase / guanosine-5'-triphosphate,3'-diphosphate pyrophosphatase